MVYDAVTTVILGNVGTHSSIKGVFPSACIRVSGNNNDTSLILDDRSSPPIALELPWASGRASDDVSLAKPTFGGRRQRMC